MKPLLAILFALLTSCRESTSDTEPSNIPASEADVQPSEERQATQAEFDGIPEAEHYNRSKALFKVIEIIAAEEDYEDLLVTTTDYLAEPKFRRDKPSVTFHQSVAFMNLGKTDEAIVGFEIVLDTATGLIKYSAPALRHACELRWERNSPTALDRKVAIDRLKLYLKQIARLLPKFTESERSDWLQLPELLDQYLNATSP